MSTDNLFACGLTPLQQAEVCERTHTFVLDSIRSRLFSLFRRHMCRTTPQTPEGFPHIHLYPGAVVLEPNNDEHKVDEPKNNNEGEDDSWKHGKFPSE